MATAGKKGLVKITGAAIQFTAEATTTGDNTVYQITDTSKRIFDHTATIVVDDAGVPTVESYTLNRLNGTITFGGADAGRVITIDGYYLPVTTAANARGWTLAMSADVGDITTFGENWKLNQQQNLSASGTLKELTTTSTTFYDDLVAGVPVVIELYYDSTADPTRIWAILDMHGIDASIENPIESNINFTGTADEDGNMLVFTA